MPLPRRARQVLALVAALLLTSSLSAPAQGLDAGAFLAARSAAVENDYAQSVLWHGRALIADPENPRLLEGMVISQMAMGDFDAAADAARKLIDLGVTSPAAYMAIMVSMAAQQDYAAVLADLESRKGVGPLLEGLVTGWSELGNGRMSEALTAFDKLTETRSLMAFGLYHKALALASAGDFEGADTILSGEAAGPINLTRRGIVAHAQILSQLERNEDALKRLDDAFGADADPGIDSLRSALRADQTLPFDVVRNAGDGLAEAFFTMATALNGEADVGYTLLYTRAAAKLRPDFSEAILMSGGLLEEQSQFDLATQTYDLILRDDPTYHVAQIGRAGAAHAAGRPDEAILILQELQKTHGQIFTVPLALGDQLRRTERFADSIPAYDTAIGLITGTERHHWPIFYSRGISHERMGEFELAEADMRKALELEPDQPQVLNYLGYSFVDRGENLEEALGMIERAVAAQPDQGYIIDSLAWAYFRLGRYEDALEPMERASLLEPVDPVVTDHLGDVYWAVGRTREAQFQWHRALSFDPEEKDAIRIRRKLEIGLDAVLAEEGAPPLSASDGD
jgi:tetratricopeptide (TPR) repeat protein